MRQLDQSPGFVAWQFFNPKENVMAKTVNPQPAHLSTVTPYLTIKDAGKAAEFYKRAFGAEETMNMPGPDGKLMHGEIKIGNSIIMIGEECPQKDVLGPISRGGATSALMVYFDNVDTAFDKAVKAGCTVLMPLTNQFWGDRYGAVTDPFGHRWSLAQHVEDVDLEEMKKRQEAACKQMAEAK
jgi:PhnB protein